MEPPSFVLAWGAEGAGDGQFDRPMGIGVDSKGFVYVADARNHRIQKFDENGTFVAKWGERGPSPGQFEGPWDVAVGPGDAVYVTDRDHHRIQKFDEDGRVLGVWGRWGYEDGEMSHPRGVALGPDGDVFVVEGYLPSDNNRVQRFTSSGDFDMAWGTFGKEPGEFDFSFDGPQGYGAPKPAGTNQCCGIRGVAVDGARGRTYVADFGNHRVQVFDLDGKLLRVWAGPNGAQLYYPQSVALDASGNVIVNDANADRRIRVYSPDGDLVAEWGGPGTGDGGFEHQPTGIAVDPRGFVYVGDMGNARIQKFAWKGTR